MTPFLKAAILMPSLSRQGAGLYEAGRRLAQELHNNRHGRAIVLGLRDEETEKDLSAWHPLPVKAFAARGPRSFGFAPGMTAALDEAHADIVHTIGLWMYPSCVASSWSKRNSQPHVISPQGMLDPWAIANSAWKKRVAALLYERRHLTGAACIHVLNASEARSARAFGLRNPLAVLPNGVDIPKDTGECEVDDKLAALFDGLGGRPFLLYLGRLHPKKGLAPLIAAWKHAAGGRDWALVVAGWDQDGHEAELKRLADENGLLDKSIFFYGPAHGDEKTLLYRRASAFVLSSHSEGMPFTVLEAWAAGLPVLMSPACNLPEGFDVGAALPVEPTRESIAHGLSGLFEMTEAARREMGENGLTLARSRFSWKRIAADMWKVYDWVLGVGEKPECIVTGGVAG